tara:strand:- start:3035 stop:3301 length:267 start_codon:yes stop_codon:yes gene_type:complete
MNERIRRIISDKIDEIFEKNDEITKIIDLLNSLDSKSLTYGLLIGRLYNSFYYQHRRILERDPTKDEFAEFLDMIKSNQNNFLQKLGF